MKTEYSLPKKCYSRRCRSCNGIFKVYAYKRPSSKYTCVACRKFKQVKGGIEKNGK